MRLPLLVGVLIICASKLISVSEGKCSVCIKCSVKMDSRLLKETACISTNFKNLRQYLAEAISLALLMRATKLTNWRSKENKQSSITPSSTCGLLIGTEQER